jgi:glycosyltransferase involved in cell wall biosynthesis
MSKPKLLWHSNAPHSPTGYGNQTALFCPLLTEHYDLRVSSFYGLEGAPMMWNGIRVLPGMGGTYGNESIPPHAQRFFGDNRGGLLVTLIDVWVLEPAMCAQFNTASWVPVDHDPAPPAVLRFFQQSGAVPLAMSRFGFERLAAFDPLYVPHAVDTEVFRPRDRMAAREYLGLEADDFLIGMVAANKGNPSRKSFVAALQAFARFRQKHENAKMYLHTDLAGIWSQGVPLGPIIDTLGIPDDAILNPDPYAIHFHPFTAETMAEVYSAMDVLVNPATGEGFGIPVLEAQACGTPVIVTDFSAMPEVAGSGWTVSGEKWWTPQQSWQVLPHVSDILEAFDHCYSLPTAARRKTAEQARQHALRYDVQVVLKDWMLPALEEVSARFEERKPLELVKAAA